jgi:RimJ/RimL family protein N-acetyltransferase
VLGSGGRGRPDRAVETLERLVFTGVNLESMPSRHVTPDSPLTDGYVTLRPPQAGDVPVIARYIGNDDAHAWLSGSGDANDLYSEYEAGWSTPDRPNRLGLTLIVTRADAEELLGLLHLEPDNGVLHVAYGVAPDQRRTGIASHALALCSAWALENGFVRVELEIGEDNTASQAVARRCGFEPTSRRRSQALPDGGEWHARAWSRES